MNVTHSDHAFDKLDAVVAVLGFVSQSLTWFRPDCDAHLGGREMEGLCRILAACNETVEDVNKALDTRP